MTEISEKIRLFGKLLRSIHSATLSVFTPEFETLFTTAEEGDTLMEEFLRLGFQESNGYDVPMNVNLPPFPKVDPIPFVVSTPIGLVWISEAQYEGDQISRIYMLGPVFTSDLDMLELDRKLEQLHVSLPLKHRFLSLFRTVPIVPLNRFQEYGIMLHYCITGREIGLTDFTYALLEEQNEQEEAARVLLRKHGTYGDEQAILKMVEDGNLNYRSVFDLHAVGSALGHINSREFLRQEKDTVLIFTVLCSRAAIRGGLSSETALTLCDQYIQEIENAVELGRLTQISHTMLEDYIRRVYAVHTTQQTISPQIRRVCDHIRLYPEKNHTLVALAELSGYTEYYFSGKFKRETGMSVREYVMSAKIDRAKLLLRESADSVSEIADRLGFSSRSHFSKVFREQTGQSPMKFRENRG